MYVTTKLVLKLMDIVCSVHQNKRDITQFAVRRSNSSVWFTNIAALKSARSTVIDITGLAIIRNHYPHKIVSQDELTQQSFARI